MSGFRFAVQEKIVGDCQQLMHLVGIVPNATFDNLSPLTILVGIDRHIAHIAVLDINDEVISRHLFHAVLVEAPRIPQSTKGLILLTLREQSRDEILDIWLRPLEVDGDVAQAVIKFKAFGLGVDGFHTVPGKGVLHRTVITAPIIDEDVLSRLG